MKKRINGFSKILVTVLLLSLVIASLAIATSAASTSSSTALSEGRTFAGVTNIDERLQLTRPLEDIPLTWEAEIKIEGTTDALCKGTLFGEYAGNGKNTVFNFEIFRNPTYPNPSPALCYVNNYTPSSQNSVVFEKDSTAIVDADGNTNTLKDHIGEWVRVAITATLVDASTYTYNIDCYINGEKAYNTVQRKNVIFTKENLEEAQKYNQFGLGANAVASNPVEFPGAIKSLALYGKALTAAEIKASYEKGITSKGTNLIAHYDMSVVEDEDFEEDLSGNRYHLRKNTDEYIVNSEGRTFSGERLVLTKDLTEAPLTFEATIKREGSGTVFGNYSKSSIPTLNFEIYSGAPALCFPKDNKGTFASVIFANNLIDGKNPMPSGNFAHVVLTLTPTGNENADTGAKEYNFDCYINGVKGYKTVTAYACLDMALIQSQLKLAVGSNGKDVNFPGNIRNVNLYNRPLSASEILDAYKRESTFGGLIAGYDMSDSSHIRNPQFEADISGNGYHVQKKSTVGKTFSETDASNPYYVYNLLTEMPRTIEATVYTTEARGCAVFSNYNGVAGNNIDLEIYTGGVPAFVIMQGGKTYSIQFKNYVVPTNTWTHLVAVNEQDVSGNAVYVLYANGIEVDRITDKPTYVTLDMELSQTATRKFSIGTDNNAREIYRYFKGSILDVAVYSAPLSATEVMDSYKNGVNKKNESLMAYYDLKSPAGTDFLQDLSGNNHHAAKYDYSALEGGRWFNYDEERLAVVKNYEYAPLTINAEVYVPSTLNQAATIFGNLYARDYINFEIYTNGRPALVIHELPENQIDNAGSGYKHSIIFDVDVRGEKWTDLTVVYDKTKTGTDKYALYVDGVKVESYTMSSDSADINHVFELDMEWIQRAIPFTLGRNASRCFQGKIKDLALYSEPLSAEEIAYINENGVDMNSKTLFAYYNLDNPKNTKTFVKDETGNGYDFAYKFFESESEGGDYDYSFAFIGDTQFLIYKDINEGTTKNAKPIYDWLIKNKDEKKLQYVFGLGDVSDKNLMTEYEYAAYLYKTLGDAGINYAAIPGNHDGHPEYNNYDSVFSYDTYISNGAVLYREGSVANYYKNFEVGEYKYMVMVLEFGAPDAVLEWANNAVASNSDRQVIVLTHGYIGYDGGFLSEKELHAPSAAKGLNSGEEIWQKFVSKHSNIIISACGHIDPYNIKQREDVGVNGNTVQQFLIDPQALDKTWSYDTGMIAMFYFSNGGKDVRVEYVSATQSLRATEKDPNAKDIVFGKENQFNFTLDIPGASEIVTKYGNIPLVNTNLDLNRVVLFTKDKTFVGAYGTVDEALAAMLAYEGTEYTVGSYNVLLRDDARMSSKVSLNKFDGEVNIDLDGYEILVDADGNYLFDIYRFGSAALTAKLTVKNGRITKLAGHGIACVNYGSDLATNDNKYEFVFDNVTFKSISSVSNTNVLFATWENGWSDGFGYTVSVDAVLNDCTFDMRSSIDNAVMIPMSYNNGTAVMYNVSVNGGTILAKSGDDLARFFSADAKDTIKFDKSENYTAITLPSGAPAPTAEYNGLEFVKVSETADEVIYRLRPAEVSDINYAPKMSITLANSFIMNVYVPINCTQEFTFNGVTYNAANSFGGVTEVIDGETYYLVTVALGSSEAAKDMKLVSKVVSGDVSATATFTFSILKYSAKLLNDAKATDVEKTLVRDVLAYIKAAYNYVGFAADNTADEIARVNTLIEGIIGDYVGTPTTSGASADNNGGVVSGVTLNLDATPSIRFYTNDASLEFFADGKKLDTVTGTDSNGTYVELDVYAYVLCETITFANGGSYHISSFVKGAQGQPHEALASAFVKYVESASDYRESVIAAD